MPETRSYRTSGSFDLFPQHCILPTFSPEQHANEVHEELKEAVQNLPKKARQKLLKTMATSLAELAAPGGTPQQGPTTTVNTDVNAIPNVTTTTNSTAPNVLQEAPRTHQRLTRSNKPGTIKKATAIMVK